MNWSRKMGFMWGLGCGLSVAAGFVVHPAMFAFVLLFGVGNYMHRDVV